MNEGQCNNDMGKRGWHDGGVVLSMMGKLETRGSRQSGWLPFMFLSRRAATQGFIDRLQA